MPSTIYAEKNSNLLNRNGISRVPNSTPRPAASSSNSNPISGGSLKVTSESSLASAKVLVGRGISRFSALNRSFNNVANLASDLKRNIENAAAFGNLSGTESAPVSASHETRSRPSRFNSSLLAEGANPEYKNDKENKLQQSSSNGSNEEEEKSLLVTPSSEFVRQLSLRVKTQVAATLSDPLKSKNQRNINPCDEACGTCARCQTSMQNSNATSSPLTKKASIKKKVADISNRLQLPKFLSDGIDDQNNDGRVELR